MNKENETQMLAKVFSSDPMFIHLFEPDKAGRRMHLIMRFLLELVYRRGKVVTEGERTDALLAYFAPGDFPVSFWRVLPLMLHLIPEAFTSTVSLGKLLHSLRVLGAIERFHPAEPHWYISMIAVDESAQGKGLGGKLMQQFLAGVDSQHQAVYLESSNPKNHNFYKRHGFQIVEEFKYSAETPPIFCMLRAKR